MSSDFTVISYLKHVVDIFFLYLDWATMATLYTWSVHIILSHASNHIVRVTDTEFYTYLNIQTYIHTYASILIFLHFTTSAYNFMNFEKIIFIDE